VDHVASAQRTRWQVVSGDEETGKQAAVALWHAVATVQAQRVGSRTDEETTAIREEGESRDFLFLFPCGWQCCLLDCSGVEAHQHVPR
jgi:hypothetical protein